MYMIQKLHVCFSLCLHVYIIYKHIKPLNLNQCLRRLLYINPCEQKSSEAPAHHVSLICDTHIYIYTCAALLSYKHTYMCIHI